MKSTLALSSITISEGLPRIVDPVADEEARRRYAFIVNTSPDLMALLSSDLKYGAVNDAFCAAHNKQRAAIVGRAVTEIDGPLVSLQIQNLVAQCLTGVRVGDEFWTELPDRGRCCLEWDFMPYLDDEGEVTHTVVICKDVTTRVEAVDKERHAAGRVGLLQRVTAAANAIGPHEEILRHVLSTICERGHWAHAVVRSLDEDETAVWVARDGSPAEHLVDATAALAAAFDGSVIPQAASADEAMVLRTGQNAMLRRIAEHDIEMIVSVPIVANQERWGTLELYGGIVTDELVAVVENFGLEIGNVLARARADAELIRSRNEYRSLFDSAHDAILVIEDDIVRDANPRACELYGYARSELINGSLSKVTGSRLEAPVDESTGAVTYQAIQRRKDGKQIVVDVHASRVEFEGRPAILAIKRDVTDRVRAEQMLRYQALHDGLTSLPNRKYIMQRVAEAFASPDPDLALLFIEMDRFKAVNDSLGLAVGDRVLIEIGRRLHGCASRQDMVARVGGDEFGVLLVGEDARRRARDLSETARRALAEPFQIGHRQVYVSACIGVAFSHQSKRPEHLMRDANIAMVRAKSFGHGSVEFFDHRMHDEAISRLELETALKEAIQNEKELSVVFQPIVHIRSRRLAGFEALVRWHRPGRGKVSPTTMIPIAEETGLIVPLGHWILRETCKQMVEWRRQYPDLPMTVNVNVSPRQMLRAEMTEQVFGVLEETGLPPNCLKLELTESLFMDEPEQTAKRLQEFRDRGVRICIDDFGTGFSSLSYLHRFPVDVVKIDRAFVRDAGQSGQHAIVRAIIALAGALEMDVVAEGIESETELAFLRALQCHYGQGYLFSRALNVEGVQAVLKNGGLFEPAAI